MPIKMVIFIVSFISSIIPAIYCGCPMSDKLYQQATDLYENRHRNDRALHELYNIAKSDYGGNFYTEGANSNSSTYQNAGILLHYQQLLKDTTSITLKDITHYDNDNFRFLLNECAEKIPIQNRCVPVTTKCKWDKYRSVGGNCNNLLNPKWGAVNMPYKHMIHASYSDGVHSIRQTAKHDELPNARLIGNIIAESNNDREQNQNLPKTYAINVAALLFGQGITHDNGNRAPVQVKGNGANGIRCCSKSYDAVLPPEHTNPNCVPIRLPENDPFYAPKRIFCQNYIRAQCTVDTDCKISSAQQQNALSATLDLSIIYSDSTAVCRKLRTLRGGLMKINDNDILNEVPCGPDGKQKCYKTGDGRATLTPQLTLIHSLLLRLHNLLAKKLAEINPNSDDEVLFNEARRIAIAAFQNIIYLEWLPLFIGDSQCAAQNLNCDRKNQKCEGYNPNIDTSTLVEHAQGAFRLFHENIPSTQKFIDSNNIVTKEMLMSDTIGASRILETEFDNLLRGMLQQEMRPSGMGFTDEIRNLMFKSNHKNNAVGISLFILDVMRGRDFGAAAYCDFYPRCLGKEIKCWDDLNEFFSQENLQLLQKIYQSFSDVDLLIGLILEKRDHSVVGAIGACIIGEQFYRYRYGDRFFYTSTRSPYPFTPEQLDEIESFTFAKLICMVTDLKEVARDSFLTVTPQNPLISCSSFTPFNFQLFKIW